MMMTYWYKHLSLVEGEQFRVMFTHIDLSIRPITRSKFTRTLTPHKFKKAETDVSSFLDGVHCVVISNDLWMSKTT